jgi:diketogulonate reductase-like aldo/keto reductase
VCAALETGYRHVDTAQMYGNEKAVGRGIRKSGIAREEVWVTTKVWPDRFRDGDLQASVRESLDRLDMKSVDLLLLHWPNPEVELAETLEALNQVHEEGMATHIGISNFTTDLIHRANELSRARLLLNQVEYHPYLDQSRVRAELDQHHMALTAYCPIAHGKVLGDATLNEIGKRHGKNEIQVTLRWLIQQEGVIAIPRSSREEHLRANFDIWDFELSDEDMRRIHDLARPDGRIISPSFAPDWD